MKTLLNIFLLPVKIILFPIYIIFSIIAILTKIILGIGGCLVSVIIFLTILGLGFLIIDTSNFSTELIKSTVITILLGLILSFLFAIANGVMTFITSNFGKFLKFWF